MDSYLINYDINSKGKIDSGLIAAIEKLSDTRWQCLRSAWIVRSDHDEGDIRDALTSHIHEGDQLLIVRLSGEGAWIGFDQGCSSWFVNNI